MITGIHTNTIMDTLTIIRISTITIITTVLEAILTTSKAT
jgi:hypothetical protein